MKNSRLIPEDKIVERLQYENPWWVTKEVPSFYKEMSKRLYFDLFYPFVQETDVRRAVVLMGPRRVGKTVMMFHTIEQLMEDGINPQRIFFVGIDNPIYVQLSLQDILDLCLQSLQLSDLKGCYIFFDEIQYLKDWERHLKVLVDAILKLNLWFLVRLPQL
ncbi:MAG: AAA family ATPase [Flavobacterium sp.]|nr:AAA family ATPase [Flavobacterium sp.]